MKKRTLVNSFLFSLLFIFIFTACSEDQQEARFIQYTEYWEEQKYDKMYNMLSEASKDSISEEKFVSRYTTIYEAIEAKDLEITINEIEEKDVDDEIVPFTLKMDTFLGELSLDDFDMQLVNEKQAEEEDWFIEWDESLIFPQMTKEDEVRIETTAAKRGEIFDKDGNPLAVNGIRYNLGIHPARFDEADVVKVATILDIDESIVQDKLDANTNPEYFVPIVKVATDAEELITELLAVEGVVSQEVESRIYPGGEAFGALIGYINPITKEELDEEKGETYTATSLIGKAGIESVYEDKLRAIDGKEIYISKIEAEEEIKRLSIAKSKAVDGENVHLSIDSDLQSKIYNEVKGDVGTASAIHPITGEVLALVSYPSYDSNFYTSYTPNAQREIWDEMKASAFENRFNKAYSPGSVFKIVTAAIGLEKGTIEPETKIRIEEKGWQKDDSWGDYKVTRVSQKLSQVNLKDAFIYSDNIYFAQNALRIGANEFIDSAKDFGFDEPLPINYPFVDSQIANGNMIETDILLADTGYGQGEVLMSALHLSSIYSALVNDGNMMVPTLEVINENAKVWKADILSAENREVLLDNLIAVIENPEGTGRPARIEGLKLAGKTGTAEFKGSQEESGKEDGWFVALDVEDPEIVLAMMIEDVEDRGGSGYTVQKARNILLDYFSIE